MTCIGMSGTPYVNRKVKFNNKLIKIQDIQDIVYYYPLTDAIANFLKVPEIRKVTSNEELLITSALDEFLKILILIMKMIQKVRLLFIARQLKN